jgi:ERCC4-type nuclease
MIPCEYKEMVDSELWSAERYATALYRSSTGEELTCRVSLTAPEDALSMQQAILEARRQLWSIIAYKADIKKDHIFHSFEDMYRTIPSLEHKLAVRLWYSTDIRSLRDFLTITAGELLKSRNIGRKTTQMVLHARELYLQQYSEGETP